MGSETFRFLAYRWDVSKAKEIVAARDGPDDVVPVAQLAVLLNTITIERERALGDEIDLAVPLIVARVPEWGDMYLTIDGWHRIYKADRLGVVALPAYLLSDEESRAVRLGDPPATARRGRR